MPLIATRSPRTRQPQGAVQASSWARSRGIGSLLLPSAGLRDLVDGGTWTTWGTAPTISAGRYGVCIDSTSAFGGLTLNPTVNQATAAQTHIMLVETTANSGAYAGLMSCALGSGSSNSLSVQRSETNTGWSTWPNDANASNWASPTSAAIGPSLLVLVGDSTGTAAYLDGVLINTGGVGVATQSNSRIVLCGERSANSSYATKARIYLYAHLTQRLTAGEIAALSANPWQLLAPTTRRIWVPSAGGGVSAALSRTLGDLTGAATGQLRIAGAASQTLGALSLASTGVLGSAVTGSLSQTLGALSLAASGQLPIVGSLGQTLGALSSSATGTLGNALTGALSQTLGALTVSAAGTLPINAALSQTLGTLTVVGAGVVPVVAQTAQTLGALTLASTGVLGATTSGVVTQTLGPLSLSATARLPITAAVSQSLGALTSAAAGRVDIAAQLGVTLGNLQIAATGSTGAPITAALAQTLGLLSLSATGGAAIVPRPPKVKNTAGVFRPPNLSGSGR